MDFQLLSWVLVIMSIIGNFFVVKKNVVGQWIWAVSNLGWIIYDLYIANYSQASLFAIYFAMCVWGIITWSKAFSFQKNQVSSN